MSSWTKCGDPIAELARSTIWGRVRRELLVVGAVVPVLGWGSSAVNARDDLPVLEGIKSHGSATSFYLRNPQSPVRRWVAAGETFGIWYVAGGEVASAHVHLQSGNRMEDVALIPSRSGAAQSLDELDARENTIATLRKLVARGCEFLVQQEAHEVSARDLVGDDAPIHALETPTDAVYRDVVIRSTACGIEVEIAGAACAPASALGPLKLAFPPAQSLARISRLLRLPLGRLTALNPELPAEGAIPYSIEVRLQ